jgi:hypothetical protein
MLITNEFYVRLINIDDPFDWLLTCFKVFKQGSEINAVGLIIGIAILSCHAHSCV